MRGVVRAAHHATLLNTPRGSAARPLPRPLSIFSLDSSLWCAVSAFPRSILFCFTWSLGLHSQPDCPLRAQTSPLPPLCGLSRPLPESMLAGEEEAGWLGSARIRPFPVTRHCTTQEVSPVTQMRRHLPAVLLPLVEQLEYMVAVPRRAVFPSVSGERH